MTIQTFCTSGEQEDVKGAVHAIAGLLALAMATYNATAWCYRRQGHLGAMPAAVSMNVSCSSSTAPIDLTRPKSSTLTKSCVNARRPT